MDAFKAFLRDVPRPAPVQGRPFESGEHVWLGRRGARLACGTLKRRGITLDEALFDAIPRQHGGDGNDLSDLRQLFEKELDWLEDGEHSAVYPDDNVRLAWNAKSYVELALQNRAHFGWHNIVAYCRHHEAALELARKADQRLDATFWQALCFNAFADHSRGNAGGEARRALRRRALVHASQVGGPWTRP